MERITETSKGRRRPNGDREFTSYTEFIEWVDTYLANTTSKTSIDAAILNINEAIKNHREHKPELCAYRRKLYKKRKEIESYAGTVTIPNIACRNINYTPEILKEMELQDPNGVIEETLGQELRKREALFVMDCVGSYVNYYRDNGPTQKMQLVALDKNPFYLINDTFDNFCRVGKITGRDKRLIKDYLFRDKKNPQGPLKRVRMVIPNGGGGHKLVEMDFISVSYIERTPAESHLLRLQDETGHFVENPKHHTAKEFYHVDKFTMQLNYRLYQYAEQLREQKINTGKIPKKTDIRHLGYFYIPKALTAKVLGFLNQMKEVGNIEDIQTGRALDRNLDKFVRGIYVILTKWQTGREVREKFMVVEYAELQKKADFPKYKGKGKHKEEDISIIVRIINQLIQDKEAFPGCNNAYLVRNLSNAEPNLLAEIRKKYRSSRYPFIYMPVAEKDQKPGK